MVKVFEGTPDEYYMDGYLKGNLETAKSVIKKDWDMIFCIDGNEGAGKSVLGFQCAKFCDSKFNINNVAFSSKQFRTCILNSQPYQAIVYDEAYTGLSSRATMSIINRTLIQMLAEIRQKNLFIFFIAPCFMDVDKYVALWRSRALLHVYTAEKFQRGYFAFFNAEKKKQLYLLGKKFYNYSKPPPNFIGRFTNHYTINEADYRKLKSSALLRRDDDRAINEAKKEVWQQLFESLIPRDDLKNKTKAAILGISYIRYNQKVNELKRKNDN